MSLACSGQVTRKDVTMTALIEVRTYRTHPGKRDELLRLLVERALPVHRKLGMRVLGPFPSLEDETTFVWLRAFPDEASRQPMKDAFYQGEPWTSELEAVMMPLIDSYSAVAVEDSIGLWDNWPVAR
jgi:hypothetical protein